MAVAFDAVGPSSAGTGNATAGGTGTQSASWSHTATGTNRYVVVGVALGESLSTASDVYTVTYGGVTMAQIGTVQSTGGTNGQGKLFGLVAPATGAQTVSVSITGSAGTKTINCGSISFTGVDQTTPVGTAATASGNSGAPSVNITGTSINNMIVDVLVNGTGAATSSGKTIRWKRAGNSSSQGGNGAQSTATSAAGSVTMSYVTGADAWGLAAIEVKEVSPGVTMAGVTATAAAAAPAGTFSTDSNLAGVTATVAAAAPAGTFSTGSTLAGPVATATATAPAGTVTAGLAVAGAVATVAASAPAGDVALWEGGHAETSVQMLEDGISYAVLATATGTAPLTWDGRSHAELATEASTTLLAEDFTALRPSVWDYGTNPGIAATAGQLILPATSDYSGGATTRAFYPVAGLTVTVELVQASTGGEADTWFQLSSNPVLNINDVLFEVYLGQLMAQVDVAGARTTVASVTYNAVDHRWLRLRDTAGTVFWEISPDGLTWTVLGTWVRTWNDPLLVNLGCGTWPPGSVTPDTVFDNLTITGTPPQVTAGASVIATT